MNITKGLILITYLVLALVTLKAALAFDIAVTIQAPSNALQGENFQTNATVSYELNQSDNISELSNQSLTLWFWVDENLTDAWSFIINPNTSLIHGFTTSIGSIGVHNLKINTTTIANESDPTNNKDETTINIQQKTASISLKPETLGSSNQERDVTTTSDLEVKNTGNIELTNIQLQATADNKYQLGINPANIASLEPGQSVNVTITCYVPEDQDSGSSNIGVITATADSSQGIVTAQTDLYLEVITHLEIRDMDITFDDHSEDVDEEETIDNIPPGASIDFEVEVKNSFDEKIDINDITVSVYNDDLDIDEESDEFDLSHGKRKRVTLSFEIPYDTSEDEYDLEITVQGEDENGATHKYETFVTLKVEKETHEINIVRVLPSRDSAFPGENFNVDVHIANIGKKDEDYGRIVILNDDLSISEEKKNIIINSGEEKTITLPITIPKSAEPGTYTFQVRTYYDYDKLSHITSFDFIVEQPITTPPPEQQPQPQTTPNETQPSIEIIQQPTPQPTTQQGVIVYGQGKPWYQETSFWLGAIAALAVIIIIALIALLVSIAKK